MERNWLLYESLPCGNILPAVFPFLRCLLKEYSSHKYWHRSFGMMQAPSKNWELRIFTQLSYLVANEYITHHTNSFCLLFVYWLLEMYLEQIK